MALLPRAGGARLAGSCVGAGIAGLACAVTLERLGIDTVVYEQGDKPGQAFAHVGVIMPVIQRPVIDVVRELRHKYGIDLRPLTQVRRIRMHGSTVERDITGADLGFTFEVSREARSVTGQLAGMYHGPVLFNTRADYFALRDAFDYVVVAGGNPEISGMLGVWQDWLRTWAVGAQVLGEFDQACIEIWFDRRFARNGYAYMVPFNDKMASLSLIVPGVRRAAAIAHWQDFLRARHMSWEVVSYWDVEHVTGYVHPYQLGNTLFVGHSGGFMDPLLGFSIFSSLVSGVLAGRAIAGGKLYAQAVESLRRSMLDICRYAAFSTGWRTTTRTAWSRSWDCPALGGPTPKARGLRSSDGATAWHLWARHLLAFSRTA